MDTSTFEFHNRFLSSSCLHLYTPRKLSIGIRLDMRITGKGLVESIEKSAGHAVVICGLCIFVRV